MDIKDLVEEAGYTPKRKSNTHNGEYSSPCPLCKEGKDCFVFWPTRCNRNGEIKGGRFFCRKCTPRGGDAITFLRQLYGLSYAEACDKLKIHRDEYPRGGKRLIFREKIKFPVVSNPTALWQEKTGLFVEWCHKQLMKNKEALDLVKARGFTEESIKRFKIGFNIGEEKYGRLQDFFRPREEWGLEKEVKDDGKEKDIWLPIGITIPTFSSDGRIIRLKVRRTNYEKEFEEYKKAIAEGKKPKFMPQKYAEISGLKKCPSVYGNTSLPCCVVVESELDALLIQQEIGDLVYCVALGGSTKPLDSETYQILKRTSLILFCPDYDEAGEIAWIKWEEMIPGIRLIITPEGKSAGDAYVAGVDIRKWIEDSMKNRG